MRRISLFSIDYGTWVYQTEEDRKEFMCSFGTLEVMFSEMEQFLNVLSGCFRKNEVDKWTICLKAKMGKEELFSRTEGGKFAKILLTFTIKVREYLSGESRIKIQLLEKYCEKYEANKRKRYVRRFETVDRLEDFNEFSLFISRVENEAQFSENYGEKKK